MFDGEEQQTRYIFLSCSEYEPEERTAVSRVLRGLGCAVRCDEQEGGDARPWRSEILDMIEGCSLFFSLHHEDRPDTVSQRLASEFASKLKKPKVFVYLYDQVPPYKPDRPDFFDSALHDPDFPEKCRLGIEAMGFFSDRALPMPEEPYDLAMTYYRSRSDRLSLTRVTKRECNTRTHEAWGFPSYRLLTDEEIYCAVRWTKERYYLISRSEAQDYRPGRSDRQFAAVIGRLKGDAPAALERQYVDEPFIPEPHRPFPPGYPAKDEFEYLSSDDDD